MVGYTEEELDELDPEVAGVISKVKKINKRQHPISGRLVLRIPTLINALLRQKLMPAKQEACTATITELKDSDATIFHAEAYDQGGNLIMAVIRRLQLLKGTVLNFLKNLLCRCGILPFEYLLMKRKFSLASAITD